MSWVRRLIAHIPLLRPASREAAQSRRAEQVIQRADRVLEDYRRQEKLLRVVAVPKR